MSADDAEASELYAGREQTLVKHEILKHYLERFAHKVGSAWDAITYVDCFAGPWNARSDQLEDSSFAVALRQLRAARDNLADLRRSRGKAPLELRCFFLEKNRDAYKRLEQFAADTTDAVVETHITRSGKGWTGYSWCFRLPASTRPLDMSNNNRSG